jgi:CP family cyanate transporter-like MFS transporter
LLLPPYGWAWIAVVGIATGSAFPLAVTLLSLRSPTPQVAAQLSGMAQTGGFLLAGVGPLIFGILHSTTSGWSVPLVVLLFLLIPETIIGMIAARPGIVHVCTEPGGRRRYIIASRRNG